MLSTYLQKPIGMVTILGAAVGGPYAVFETDIGTQLRQAVAVRLAQSPNPGSNQSSNPNAQDPYSLVSLNGSSGSMPSSLPQPSSWLQNDPNTRQGMSSSSPNAYSNVVPDGKVISTQYGPISVQPLGPSPMQPGTFVQPMGTTTAYNVAYPPNPPIETRSGPAAAIPGRTDQLWDYTLGTPSLGQIQQQPNAALGGGTIVDLREVLRFDIVPGWLPQRFARVSTVTSNVQMDGLRVPLITGTQPKDIAGTLTYYFDASQQLKRINLHGLTGDPSQLANLMVQYYQLKPEPSLGGQLFTTSWNNRITSVMQVTPAPIIYAGADHSKYILFLELNQPTNQYGLSEEASEILRTAKATMRW